VARAVPAVLAVPAAMVVLLESVAALMELRAVPRARRALSDWRPRALPVVRAPLVVPGLTPRI